jgi:hypothetical protein
MTLQTKNQMGALVYNERIAPIFSLDLADGCLVVRADATDWPPGVETNSVFKIFAADGSLICEVGPVGPLVVVSPDELPPDRQRIIEQRIVLRAPPGRPQ